MTDSTIENCTFVNVGGAIPGNRRQSDHSTLYISGRNVTVAGNHLSNPFLTDSNAPPAIVVAGIEMHGDDMLVTGNRVDHYGTGGYIVGDGIVTARNHRWANNSFTNLTQLGITIWSISEVANIMIEANRIELDGRIDQAVAGVFQSLHEPDTTLGIDGITIRNNTIQGTNVKAGTVWNGIQLTAARDVVIEGNLIERISGAGIIIMGTTNRRPDCRNIIIRDNTVRDTGFNRYGAYPYAIDLTNTGRGRFDAITVADNRIESTIPLTDEMRGIRVQGSGPVAGVNIDNRKNLIHLKQNSHIIDDSGMKEAVTVMPATR
ncbi:hypothetical protein CCP3SC15_1280011 [Gammaproteobacteria bacterium]